MPVAYGNSKDAGQSASLAQVSKKQHRPHNRSDDVTDQARQQKNDTRDEKSKHEQCSHGIGPGAGWLRKLRLGLDRLPRASGATVIGRPPPGISGFGVHFQDDRPLCDDLVPVLFWLAPR